MRQFKEQTRKDNRRDHFDLCESCYDELTRNFKIKMEEE